jgi:hypothetical protein
VIREPMSGYPIIFSVHCPRPGAVVFQDEQVIVAHPWEEPHIWMLAGEADKAFQVLDGLLGRYINDLTKTATARLESM